MQAGYPGCPRHPIRRVNLLRTRAYDERVTPLSAPRRVAGSGAPTPAGLASAVGSGWAAPLGRSLRLPRRRSADRFAVGPPRRVRKDFLRSLQATRSKREGSEPVEFEQEPNATQHSRCVFGQFAGKFTAERERHSGRNARWRGRSRPSSWPAPGSRRGKADVATNAGLAGGRTLAATRGRSERSADP